MEVNREAIFSTPFLTDDDLLFDSIHSYLCANYQEITLTQLAER